MPHERTYDIYDDEGKASQRSVNLRWSKSGEHEQCSLCENWLGHMRTKGGSLTTGACALVEGQIKTHEICDLYEKGPKFYDRLYGSKHPGAQGKEWCEKCQDWFHPGHSH